VRVIAIQNNELKVKVLHTELTFEDKHFYEDDDLELFNFMSSRLLF